MDFQQIYSNKRRKTVAGIKKKAIAENGRGIRTKCQKLYLSQLWSHI